MVASTITDLFPPFVFDLTKLVATMTRRKMWLAILGLAAGIIIGIKIEPLISGDSIYEQLQKFREVLFIVEKNYVDDVETPKLVEAAITGLLGQLDPHSVYIPAEQQKRVEEDFRGSFEGIGVEFDVVRDTITIVAAISGGPSEALGIQAGDKIVKIDGKDAVGLKRDEVPKVLRGRKGTHVVVGIVRPGVAEPLVFDIERDKIPLYTVDAAFVAPDGTGYISVNRFAEPTYDEFMKNMADLRAKGMKRLILDLRGNPGGYMDKAIRMADEFVSGGKKIVYTKSGRSPEEEAYFAQPGQEYESLPLIILINRGSASASEIVSGAIQDLDRGLIVGETSFGKGLVQRQFSLDDGSAFRLTIARYYTPSGRLIQRPYDGGRDAYYGLAGRDEGEEGDNVNHTSETPDSTKPVYKTLGGRNVLGGGGITPDYVVKMDTLTPFGIDIFRKNVLWEFTENLFSSTEGQKIRQSYPSFPDFAARFTITDAMWDRLMALAKKKEINAKPEDVAADRGHITIRLKAQIARGLFGNSEYYQIVLNDDRQYQKALTLFPEAARIARLTMR